MYTCMATKTISIDLAAYEALARARLTPDESFSRVIKRARWAEGKKTGAALMAAMLKHEPMSEDILNRLDNAQKTDRPPRNKWK